MQATASILTLDGLLMLLCAGSVGGILQVLCAFMLV
jgi:hypothetical protein